MSDENKSEIQVKSGELQTAREYALSPNQYQERDEKMLAMINVGVEKGAAELEKLMELYERWQAAQSKQQFILAMSSFKANCPEVKKDKKVSYQNSDGSTTEYEFCSLANMVETVQPAMAANGISHNWLTSQENGVITVTCVVTHASGHQERSTLISQPDSSGGKNSIQSIGSTITYLKRYTFQAATGIAVQDIFDDDGQGANKKPEANERPDTREFLSDGYFDGNFQTWSKSITEGKNTKANLIAYCESKGKLTDKQREKINALEEPKKQ